jgi:predicted nucleic-acid-binding protein
LTGLDTNVLIRFFVKDDPVQSLRAKELIDSLTREEPGWIALTTVVELVWVIDRRLHGGRTAVTTFLGQLLTREDIVIENSTLVERAFQRYRNRNADFADCLIAVSAQAAGCSKTVTFDRKAARDAGMELLA